MDELRESAAANRNFIEKILLKIPGFKGYLEKEYRRETDHLFRQFTVQRLGEGKKRLNDATRAVTNAGKIRLLQTVVEINNLVEKVENRIRFASHGYSGFFDVVKIREQQLDALYEFDLRLLDHVEDIVTQLSDLENQIDDDNDFKTAVRQCAEMLRNLDSLLDERKNSISGLN